MTLKTITMTNPTNIAGVEEYRELFWVPSIAEHRELAVWREVDGTYAFAYTAGEERYETGFTTAQEAYERGMATVRLMTPDAVEA